MSDNQTQQQAPRKRNWIKIFLIISVSINLLIAGAIISRFIVAKRMIYAHGMGAPGLMLRESRHMLRSATRERRNELRQMMRPHRDTLSGSRQEIGRKRAEIAKLLNAENLNREALRSALKRLNAAEDRAHMTVTKLREDFLLALTVNERRRFADGMLKKRLKRFRDRGGRR